MKTLRHFQLVALGKGLAAVLVAGMSVAGSASAFVINFESLGDGTSVTNQFAGSGITFQNAIALRAGQSLNEVDFPPHSGATVVADDGGPITITLSNPASSVGGYFTYNTGLTLSAFGLGNNLLGTITSAFGANTASGGEPGSSSNEFLEIAATGIAALTISGDPNGGSFVLDDLTVQATAVPEPTVLGLLGLGLAGFVLTRRTRT